MKKIEIYTTPTCWYCRQAKALLDNKGARYIEHDATTRELRVEARERSGRRTVPQIFIDGESIGGYDDIQALEDAGALDKKLGLGDSN